MMNKITVTPEQLTYLEALVISYMLIAENKGGFSESIMTSLLDELDVKWEALFEERHNG